LTMPSKRPRREQHSVIGAGGGTEAGSSRSRVGGGGGGGIGSSSTAHDGLPSPLANEVELGSDLVHELIDDINEELGLLVADFFYVALPADSITAILVHLDVRTLVGCACVSRQWQRFAEDDAIWRQSVARLSLEERQGQGGANHDHEAGASVMGSLEGAVIPEEGVKLWLRRRVERQRACDKNWRERVCVLHSAHWGLKGSRIQRPPTGCRRDRALDPFARVVVYDFVVHSHSHPPLHEPGAGTDEAELEWVRQAPRPALSWQTRHAQLTHAPRSGRWLRRWWPSGSRMGR
jgi:hypothetical protein